jgi:isopenicillin-N N-acyltransferase-like protein
MPRAEVLALAEACLPDHEAYAPALYQELQGLAAATNLSLAELLIVGGFTDFVDTVYRAARQKNGRLPIDDCTAFIVPDSAANGAGFFGQTWDMHDSATEFVILLDVQPDDAPRSLVFTTTGCLGQMGMNEHGICVGINNLLGADGQIGVTWPFVVRKVLQQTTSTTPWPASPRPNWRGRTTICCLMETAVATTLKRCPAPRPSAPSTASH